MTPAEKEKMAKVVSLEIAFDVDTEIVGAMLIATGSDAEEVAEYKKRVRADRDEMIIARATCPDGKVAVWKESPA